MLNRVDVEHFGQMQDTDSRHVVFKLVLCK